MSRYKRPFPTGINDDGYSSQVYVDNNEDGYITGIRIQDDRRYVLRFDRNFPEDEDPENTEKIREARYGVTV